MSIWRLVIGLMLLGGVVACGDPPPPAAGPITPEERARAAVGQRGLEVPVERLDGAAELQLQEQFRLG